MVDVHRHGQERVKGLKGLTRKEKRELLSQSPWSWPSDSQKAEQLARALDLIQPDVGVGSALLVEGTSADGGIWRLDEEGGATFGAVASHAYRATHDLVQGAVGFLGTPSKRRSPGARRLATATLTDKQPKQRSGLEGPSFGLSFALSHASRLFDLPVPKHVAATAAVESTGQLAPVGRMASKLHVLGRRAPGVTTLLVAEEQEFPDASVPEHLNLVRLSHVREAIEHVFGDHESLADHLIPRDAPPEKVERTIHTLFRIAMGPRNAVLGWAAVAETATTALERWTTKLEGELLDRLQLAAAIALRHHANAPLPTPLDLGLLESVPPVLVVPVAAELLQTANDTGNPDPAATLRVVDRMLDEQSPSDDVLKLRGARARMVALRGISGAEQASADLLDICDQRLRGISPEGISHPVCELLRLAGLLRRPEQYERAVHFAERAAFLGASVDGPYLYLARARAELELGMHKHARDSLEKVLEGPSTGTEHVTFSACRLWAHLPTAEEWPECLREEPLAWLEREWTAHHLAPVFLALAELDRDDADHVAALATLKASQGPIVDLLLEFKPDDETPANWVARAFPY